MVKEDIGKPNAHEDQCGSTEHSLYNCPGVARAGIEAATNEQVEEDDRDEHDKEGGEGTEEESSDKR